MIAFIKDFWKSFLLGALGALVLLYIGLFVYDRLTPNTTREVASAGTHNTAKPPPPEGHLHADTPHTPPPKIKRVRTKANTRQNRALKNIGTTIPITHPVSPPRLPTDIQARLNQIYQEMIATGTMYEIRNGRLETTKAAHKRKYEVLVGDMEPEDAVAFLEMHGIYNPIILDKLEPRRAIDYLYKVRARQKDREVYARSILARDPGNPDAQMVLLSVEPNNAVAAAGYRNIVAKHPENIRALNRLGYRLHYDHPEEAIQYLKKVNSLDSTRGFYELGLASERLGDFKTAWLYYRKQQTIQNGDLVVLHKRAIEMGKPLYKPISRTPSPTQEFHEVPLDIREMTHEETFAPVAEDTPWIPELPSEERDISENQLTDKENRKAARAEAARAEFQRQQTEFQQHAAAQRELEEFLKWAESIMTADESIDFDDFLSKEFAAHLKGGDALFEPERTVRAFEMIERYGPEEGLQKLKEKDPELAKQMERLFEERRPPRRNNP